MKQIILALLNAQKEMGNAIKDSENLFFKSKYADLNSVREAILPQLHANNIVVLQPIVFLENKSFVKTILYHESGESIESITEIICKNQNDAQAQGSGISYARRYALQSLLCIGADDDDGQIAVKPKPEQKQEPAKQIENDLLVAIENMKNAKSRTQMAAVFNANPKFHTNEQFLAELAKTGAKYPKSNKEVKPETKNTQE